MSSSTIKRGDVRVPHWSRPIFELLMLDEMLKEFPSIMADVDRAIEEETNTAVKCFRINKVLHQLISPDKSAKYQHDLAGCLRASAFYYLFRRSEQLVYKIAEIFGDVLSRVDCKIDVKYLPQDQKIRCIELPNNLSMDMKNGDFARCVYVAVSSVNQTSDNSEVINQTGLRVEYVIDILVPLFRDGEPNPTGNDIITISTCENEDLESALHRAVINSTSPTGFSLELVSYVLKSLLYINSGDPDLRGYRPQPKPRSARKYKQWLNQNVSPIAMTFVGFDYKKPVRNSIGSTWVETFPRWQPYGPKLSKIKLIWVRAHERTFKRGNNSEEIEGRS